MPPAAARAGDQIQFQIAVATGSYSKRGGHVAQRSAAQVGVQQHAGGVDHRPQARGGETHRRTAHPRLDHRARRHRIRGTDQVELTPHQIDAQPVRKAQIGQLVDQPVDRRNRRERVPLGLSRVRGITVSRARRVTICAAHCMADTATSVASWHGSPGRVEMR